MSRQNRVTRRNFLKTTGVVAASATAMSAASYARAAGANDRLNMAILGCGKIATHHLKNLLPMREEENMGIVAVCDVYDTRAKEFEGQIKEAGDQVKVIHDYRDVLAMKDVDYVLVSTPEHQHAHMTLDALDAGKHVYCEKPVTHTIPEAQAVLAKAKKTGLKLQVGVQGLSDDTFVAANEAIRAGKLGTVVEAHIEYCRSYEAGAGPWRTDTDPNMTKPADLDWESWLGPANKRAWEARRYFEWRNYKDYSGGIATDLFIHRLSRILKACDLTYPKRVAGMGGIYLWPDGRELPDNLEMLAEYPPVEGITNGMTVHVLGTMANRYPYGHCIRGHKATMVLGGKQGGFKIIEERSGKLLQEFTRSVPGEVTAHHKNHHAAIRSNVPLNCPPEMGLYGVVAVRMGNLSCFESKMYVWDEKNNKAVPS